jgi:hypothetical protein
MWDRQSHRAPTPGLGRHTGCPYPKRLVTCHKICHCLRLCSCTGKHRRITLLECPPDLPGELECSFLRLGVQGEEGGGAGAVGVGEGGVQYWRGTQCGTAYQHVLLSMVWSFAVMCLRIALLECSSQPAQPAQACHAGCRQGCWPGAASRCDNPTTTANTQHSDTHLLSPPTHTRKQA